MRGGRREDTREDTREERGRTGRRERRDGRRGEGVKDVQLQPPTKMFIFSKQSNFWHPWQTYQCPLL